MMLNIIQEQQKYLFITKYPNEYYKQKYKLQFNQILINDVCKTLMIVRLTEIPTLKHSSIQKIFKILAAASLEL